jgi:hypothetical protein
MRRTTCWEFFGPLLRGIKDGSKSGGKYLFNTDEKFSFHKLTEDLISYLYAQTWWTIKRDMAVVVEVGGIEVTQRCLPNASL